MTDFPTTADSFAGAPPAFGRFVPTNHAGALAVFVPLAFEANRVFPWGNKDCCDAAVWIVAGEGAGAEWQTAEVSGARMAGQLAARIGQMVLGRIVEQGTGAKRPYVVAAPSEDDIKLGNTWLAASNNRAKVERALRQAALAQAVADATPDLAAAKPSTELPPPPPVTQRDEPEF
jgi:hypothetical protein